MAKDGRIGVFNCAGPRESEWKEGHKAGYILGRMMIGGHPGRRVTRGKELNANS